MDNKKREGRATSSQGSRVCSGGFSYKYYSNPNNKKATNVFETFEEAKNKKKLEGKGIVKKVDEIGAAFYTYAEEVASEIFIERSSKTEVKTQSMKWGSLMEVVLFNKLGMGWTMCHKQTILHPKYGHIWSGTPDLIADLICAEVKCFEPKNFGLLSMCLAKKDVELLKKKFPKEYWQVISNCIITEKKKAMIIAYMPKLSELEDIIDKISNTDFLEDNGLKVTDYYFMDKENIESLPYLNDDAKIDSIQSFQFDVPEEDVEFMTKRIIEFDKQVQEYLKKTI